MTDDAAVKSNLSLALNGIAVKCLVRGGQPQAAHLAFVGAWHDITALAACHRLCKCCAMVKVTGAACLQRGLPRTVQALGP